MKPVEVARETLRRAVELHVLETEDVSAAGSLLQDPRELVDALKDENYLAEAVEVALRRLIELRPLGGPRSQSATSKRRVELGGTPRTLAPARQDEPAPKTAVGTPDADEGPRVSLESNEGTVAPARDAARPPAPDPNVSTVVPLSEAGPRGRGVVGGPVDLGDRSSTVAPARGEVSPRDPSARTSATRVRAPAAGTPPESADSLLDLSVLEPNHRRAIECAAFCRIALRMGKVTREQIAAASADGATDVEERLLEGGAIDQATAMDVVAARASTRTACGNCFSVLPPNHDAASACPICGQAANTSSSSRISSATLAEGGGVQGIEGFPGQGGMFAGYELIDRIAEGGMGVVFKARQTKLNRVVALKVMRGGSLANKERRRRFRQEAESAAALRHPCIVPVHEIDEVAGYPFYTMEFVEGVTMDRYVQEKKLDPKKVCEIVRNIADAVQHFHLRGIIHRDLKPGNILIGEDGVPKIIDFGIAKKLVPDSDSSTIEGEVLGTPYYMSPEQATGRVTEVDTRTDVYALGAILFELLTGAPPWKGYKQARLIAAIQEEDPEPIRSKNPAVELDLESVVYKAMAKERERRYQSAADLSADLERYEKNMPVTARPATLGYRLKKYIRRRLPVVIGVSVFLVMLGAVGTALAWQAGEKRREVEKLLAEGHRKDSGISDREACVARALGMDPNNEAALMLKESLANERKTIELEKKREQDKKDEEARIKQAKLEADLKAERLEREAKLAEERQAAEKESIKKAKEAADKRATDLWGQAKAKKNALDAVPDLQEALVVVPKESGELRAKIENTKIDLELGLAREQVAKNQSGLARFWLGDARRVESAKGRAGELDAVETELKKLESGEEELKGAHALVTDGKWLAAKAKLEQLKKLNIDPARFAADQSTVEKTCAQIAARLVAEGRTLLGRGDAANGMAKALEAAQFESSEAAKALVSDCEREDALSARKKAAEGWRRPETQKTALVVLAEAAARVQDLEAKASLEAERAARARLLDDRSLAGLFYVPALPDLGVRACYVQRTEVTNAEYKQFVDAGGYQDASLWAGVPAEVAATFKDGCAGGTCNHKAPRTWTNGTYGDAANADRPVCGITLHEARAYARWKTKQGKGEWRLPTASEWEVAAGFDPTTRRLSAYPWGDEWSAQAISIAGELPRPVAAAAGDASALGGADMGGNAMEWIVQKDGSPGTKGAAYALTEPEAKRFALVRNTGTPGDAPPAEVLQWIGFRLVRAIEEK